MSHQTTSVLVNYAYDQFGRIPNEADRRNNIRQYCADFVRYRRKQQGLSQRELARKSKLTQPSLARIESGKWESIKIMARLWRTLGYEFNLTFEEKR